MNNRNADDARTNLLTRGDFLARAGGAVLTSFAAAANCLGGQSTTAQPHRWKGRTSSNIKRWDVITIGN
ncbi:MAG: hypothetical protein AAB403_05630, partial [Planctomycetota bacterium]